MGFKEFYCRRLAHGGLLLFLSVGVSACAGLDPSKKFAKTSSAPPEAGIIRTETKFTSKEYGVDVSDRVIQSVFQPIPRGGGRAQVGKPYKIRGRWYKPRHQPNYNKVGIASWYGPNFHGRKTANGEIFDQTRLTAAHPTLPLPSYVRVTNLRNKRSVIVRVNDRGPFVGNRIIDLSYRTAELLGTRAGGLAKVRVQYVGKARLDGKDDDYLLASYKGPGSTKPSEIAAREKLLAYAGLSTEDIAKVKRRRKIDPPKAVLTPAPIVVANSAITEPKPVEQKPIPPSIPRIQVVRNIFANAPSEPPIGEPLALVPNITGSTQ